MKKERKLYKIGHLSDLIGITHRTIRYYDQLGLLPHVKRSEGGVRLFDESDIVIIKKIRRMQKEEFLPLDVIKDRLFNKSDTDSDTIGIVTDSGALLNADLPGDFPVHSIKLLTTIGELSLQKDKELSATFIWEKSQKLNELPKFSAPKEEDLIALYKKLSKKYKKIYSIHTGSSICNMVDIAKKASNKVIKDTEVEVIDSNTIGSGLGLFVEIIGQSIYRKDSLEEVELLLKKQIPMSFQVGISGNLRKMCINHSETFNTLDIINKFINFIPVFTLTSQTGVLNIEHSSSSKEEGIETLKEVLDAEIVSRGRYMNSIIISYSFLYTEALTLCNELKILYPSISIILQEASGPPSMYFGPELLVVAIN
jgi:fatty acid-binding protein DegV